MQMNCMPMLIVPLKDSLSPSVIIVFRPIQHIIYFVSGMNNSNSIQDLGLYVYKMKFGSSRQLLTQHFKDIFFEFSIVIKYLMFTCSKSFNIIRHYFPQVCFRMCCLAEYSRN